MKFICVGTNPNFKGGKVGDRFEGDRKQLPCWGTWQELPDMGPLPTTDPRQPQIDRNNADAEKLDEVAAWFDASLSHMSFQTDLRRIARRIRGEA